MTETCRNQICCVTAHSINTEVFFSELNLIETKSVWMGWCETWRKSLLLIVIPYLHQSNNNFSHNITARCVRMNSSDNLYSMITPVPPCFSSSFSSSLWTACFLFLEEDNTHIRRGYWLIDEAHLRTKTCFIKNASDTNMLVQVLNASPELFGATA